MNINSIEDIESFSKKFFASKTGFIKWHYHEGVYHFNKCCIAIISLDDTRIKDYYDGYNLKIIHLQSGNILSFKRFLFCDYVRGWGKRYDSDKCLYEAKDIRRWHWYISNYIDQEAIKEMVESIFEYINEFKISFKKKVSI